MMSKRIVIVTPTSKRGLQLTTRFGREWVHIHTRKMQCFNNEMGHAIRSKDGLHYRNIRTINDKVLDLTAWVKG
jgi:hypothetical protein